MEACGERWENDPWLVQRWAKKFLHVATEAKVLDVRHTKGLAKYLEDLTEEERNKHMLRKQPEAEVD